MLVAFTRAVPSSIEQCELTHLERTHIDFARASAQHDAYEALLARLGCVVRRLEPAPALPDSVFVEDTAVVLDEVAIVTRPGAASRRAETDAMAAALGPLRELRRIEAPATMDGGDVLRAGRRLFVGITARTTIDAARQLERLARPFGYSVHPVPVSGCLHLKTAVTAASDEVLVINPSWVDAQTFDGLTCVAVDPDEPFAANVLAVGHAVICAAASEKTSARIRALGFAVHAVDVSELAKAEGGVTCCSVLCSVVR